MFKRQHGRVRGLVIENLSMGGAFVRTSEPLPVGTPVELELVRPGLKKAIHLVGSVVSQGQGNPPGMAIAFEPYDRELGWRLHALLQALAPGRGLDGDVLSPQEAVSDATALAAGGVRMELSRSTREAPAASGRGASPSAPSRDWQLRVEALEREVQQLRAENDNLHTLLASR